MGFQRKRYFEQTRNETAFNKRKRSFEHTTNETSVTSNNHNAEVNENPRQNPYKLNHKNKNKTDEKINQRAKIIVRNLPFKGLCEAKIKEIFDEFGDIQEINLLKRQDGSYVGCGFVRFSTVSSAAKAIYKVNGRELQGRPVIVDWALPKDTFIQKVQSLNADKQKSEKQNNDAEVVHKDSDDGKKNDVDNDEDDLDSHDSYEEDLYNDNDDDEDDLDEEDDKDELKHSTVPSRPRIISNDVNEGKTVFVKNIPFSVTNEELRACFEQFGSVVYALVCVDPVTEHSKGTGFVKFREIESAQECIKESSKITLNDYPVEVTIAVSKEDLTNKKAKKPATKDSRNLYLVREGVIMAGSAAAEGVSSSDMAKRLQIEQWKTTILRNLNMFIARTRLVIHNLPSHYDDAKLRALVVKHSSPKAFIKEARVMRDRKVPDASGLGKSKEIGFVTFGNHEDAIAALRSINNNPDIFTSGRRPIVGFSVENKAILNLKQKRVERSRAKLGTNTDQQTTKQFEKLNKKQRRAIKRKENLIRKRQETKKLKRGEATETPKETPLKNETKKTKEAMKAKPQKIIPKARQETSKAVKRKGPKNTNETPLKKAKVQQESSFSGVVAEPGQKMKPRSRLKIAAQVATHQERKKKEKQKKKELKRQKMKTESIKQPKQKKGKTSLNNDAKFTKLVSQYKKKIESSGYKKWYES